MPVTPKNQVIFDWVRCRDGYEVRKDNMGAPWLHPMSDNLEPIQPLDDGALFCKLADLTLENEETVVRFVKETGLSTPTLEPDPLAVFTVPADTMRVLIAARDRGDYTSMSEQFNPLLKPASFHLELQPRNQRPALRYRPKTLLEAIWTQFALAVTRNEIQKRCVVCNTWFAPINAKGQTCSGKCRTTKSRKKSKGVFK